MSMIDEVIARSRQPGTFTERHQFTVERGRAIEKMREFALVDPHYYILELIQSAVANGASYIDIQADRSSVVLSYIGGSFLEGELAQLFDFLFASKDDVEHGALRQMALGVNALMLFEPSEIVIETGDGTLEGTTRIVIQGGKDIVEVGRPEQALRGTFIRAAGMRRRRVARRSALKWFDGNPPEYSAVEERCITAPVPILFNTEPIFGYSSQRLPTSLFGIDQALTFDEGDLYGSIGIARRHSGAVFKIITNGVWLQSVRRSFTVGGRRIDNIGGVITFDGLRKTADHSTIVEDERYVEMWIRVQSYVAQLFSEGRGEESFEVQTLGGEVLEGREVIETLRSFETVVAVPAEDFADSGLEQRAWRLGEVLQGPVLRVPMERLDSLRHLAAGKVNLVVPNLRDERELEFYERPQQGDPQRPWLMAPVELEPLSLKELVEGLPWPDELDLRPPPVQSRATQPQYLAAQKVYWALGHRELNFGAVSSWKQNFLDPYGPSVRGRLYSPAQGSEGSEGWNVEVRSTSRVVWRGWLDEVVAGQALVIDVADLSPLVLDAWSPAAVASVYEVYEQILAHQEPETELSGGMKVVEWLAEKVVEKNIARLEEGAEQALQAAMRIDVEPGSRAARLLLATVGRRVMPQIASDGGRLRVRFSVIDPGMDERVLELPLLKTLAGEAVSLQDLELLWEQGRGLIYGVNQELDEIEVDLRGLDQRRILALDSVQERLVVALVGPTAYVRVDERDILAKKESYTCRDVALGLQRYRDFPLLIEGRGDWRAWSDAEKSALLLELLGQLIQVIQGEAKSAEAQEDRRQAWRHLQYFALKSDEFSFARDGAAMVEHLPLFTLADGRSCTTAQLKGMLGAREKVEMLDGRARGVGEWTFEEAAARRVAGEQDLSWAVLGMEPFVLYLLEGRVQGSSELALSVKDIGAEEARQVDYLEEFIFDDGRLSGRIGVPLHAVRRPAVVVYGAQLGGARLRTHLGVAYGMVGEVRLISSVDSEELTAILVETARRVLSQLLKRLPELAEEEDAAAFERALQVLLGFAGRQVQWEMSSAGEAQFRLLDDGLARRILSAPILKGRHGLPMSTIAVFQAFQRHMTAVSVRGGEESFEVEQVLEEIPAAFEGWLRRQLNPGLFYRPSRQVALNQAVDGEGDVGFVARFSRLLNELRPDEGLGHGLAPQIFVRDVGGLNDGEGGEFCRARVANGRLELFVNKEHRLMEWAVRDGEEKAMAWALLAAYAEVNNVLEPVTNEHELIFQQRVLQALRRGEWLSG